MLVCGPLIMDKGQIFSVNKQCYDLYWENRMKLEKWPFEGQTNRTVRKWQRANNMYLLTEWEGRTGKYLARGHGVRTERSEVRAP